MNKPKKGQTFTHDHFMDTNWKPNSGQKWKDAPKAQMVITSVWETLVYYSFLDGKGSWVDDKDSFMDKFGDQL